MRGWNGGCAAFDRRLCSIIVSRFTLNGNVSDYLLIRPCIWVLVDGLLRHRVRKKYIGISEQQTQELVVDGVADS